MGMHPVRAQLRHNVGLARATPALRFRHHARAGQLATCERGADLVGRMLSQEPHARRNAHQLPVRLGWQRRGSRHGIELCTLERALQSAEDGEAPNVGIYSERHVDRVGSGRAILVARQRLCVGRVGVSGRHVEDVARVEPSLKQGLAHLFQGEHVVPLAAREWVGLWPQGRVGRGKDTPVLRAGRLQDKDVLLVRVRGC
mmetsp:Transcript_6263/g.19136  ORF Transcript_6263/g.19136 Transcript_6263/m.19136 type:complete len:200 (-) Transcript_6263:150-749(-)